MLQRLTRQRLTRQRLTRQRLTRQGLTRQGQGTKDCTQIVFLVDDSLPELAFRE